MIDMSLDELEASGLNYREERFSWVRLPYSVETCLFTDDGTFVTVDLEEYFELWKNKLKRENPSSDYYIIKKTLDCKKPTWIQVVSWLTIVEVLRGDKDDS